MEQATGITDAMALSISTLGVAFIAMVGQIAMLIINSRNARRAATDAAEIKFKQDEAHKQNNGNFTKVLETTTSLADALAKANEKLTAKADDVKESGEQKIGEDKEKKDDEDVPKRE